MAQPEYITPNAELDAQFQVPAPQHVVSSHGPNGVKHAVGYTQYGDLSNPKNKIIITVHGLTGDGYNFHDFSEYAKAEGWCVVNIDMVGRGNSDNLSDPAHYTYEQYSFDIVQVCNDVYERLPAEQQDITKWYYLGTSMGGILGMILCGGLLEKYAFRPKRFEAIVLNDIGPSVGVAGVNAICKYVSIPTYFKTRDEAADYYTTLYSATFGPFVDRAFFLRRAIVSLQTDEEDPTRFAVRYHRAGVLNGVKDETLEKLEVYQQNGEEDETSYLNQQLVELPNVPQLLEEGATLHYSFWPYFKAMQVPMMVYHGVQSTLLTAPLVAQMKHCYTHHNKQRFEYVPWEKTGHVPPFYKDVEHIPVLKFFESVE